jgi:phosphatidylserine/phosphatidylglycerophosphate/cardiolipin synthase-like enzyme
MVEQSLSDDSIVCQDFTAASVLEGVDRLQQLQTALAELSENKVSITKSELNSLLLENTSAEEALTVNEFNALMVSLSNTTAATELETTPDGYHAYTFEVNPNEAIQVLDQQVIASVAIEQLYTKNRSSTQPEVELVATLPREIRQDVSADVGKLGLSLRKMLINASHTVRVANPYFDPDQWIIEDIAAVPRRGIDTRILTREATGVDVSDRTLDAITSIVESLDGDTIDNVSIRDFYETNETGYQIGAVHAKIICVDEKKCYIGSANLTDLNLTANFEFGVIISGEIVSEVVTVFDAIFEEADSVPV